MSRNEHTDAINNALWAIGERIKHWPDDDALTIAKAALLTIADATYNDDLHAAHIAREALDKIEKP